MRLERLLIESARHSPDAPAVHAANGRISYSELDRMSDQIALALRQRGVRPSSRVALWLDKSIVCVACMQAVLRLGAAYVPLDPLSPKARIIKMLDDCAPTALITTAKRADLVMREYATPLACLVVHDESASASPGESASESVTEFVTDWPVADVPIPIRDQPTHDIAVAEPESADLDEHALAFILYTSGSTGTPKGVCISHDNAWSFIEWAAATIDAVAGDHFSNHAPFHFDLSVLDLYVTFLVGARVSLVSALISYTPSRLIAFMRKHEITVWYSVPSAIIMMLESDELLRDPALQPRVLIFAGEPFPLPQLARLRTCWQRARFFNFYGPTETNVCTAYEVLPAEVGALHTVPIGTPASGDEVWLETESGERPALGEPGEVIVDGPTVMLGYWGREPQAGRPYRTGDIARYNQAGQLEFLGRRDHMVKVRGHRVELGEIESVLHTHPDIREAAVVVHGDGRNARLLAFLVARPDTRPDAPAGARPSLLAIKQLCAEQLPRYEIVDRVYWLTELPRTANGKIDRKRLLEHQD